MRVLAGRVRYENPYAVTRLPFLAELHVAAWSPSTRMREELAKLPLRRLFSACYRLGGGTGEFKLEVKGKPRAFPFDARNLQFTALYMPQHRLGYESETAALLDILLEDDAVFLDVGSNWGYYALWLASRTGFTGRVHAFEPLPASFRDLKNLAKRADLGDQFVCHDFALSDQAGECRIAVPDGLHSGLAKLSLTGERASRRRLDDLDLGSPRVVKIDAEDHEWEVLAGGKELISKAKPFIVFESFWGRQDAEAQRRPFVFLAEKNYRFFHPCWVARIENGFAEQPRNPDSLLGLFEFEAQQRFLLRQHLNVLACPESRLAELEGVLASEASR